MERRGKYGLGRPSECACPICGYRTAKPKEVLCRAMKCQMCGNVLVRAEGVVRV